MRPSSSPAWLTGATRICSASRPLTSAGSQTDAQAVPDTPARVTTGRSRGETTSEPGPRSGTEAARSSTSPDPGVDLGAREAHGLAQRLGQLQQQLVHGDGAGEPAAEGPQDLVGSLA